MNYNIFNPKGKIDQSMFIIYYIVLMVIYFIAGLFLFPVVIKYTHNIIFPAVFILVINLLILFNYKKRFMDICNNCAISLAAAFILTFDHLLIPLTLAHKNSAAIAIFYIAIFLVFIIQPAIAALIPEKK